MEIFLGSEIKKENDLEIERLRQKARLGQHTCVLELKRDKNGFTGYDTIYNFVIIYPNGRKIFRITSPEP